MGSTNTHSVMDNEAVKLTIGVALVVLCLHATALVFRPLLPVDETRYLSVAWEMHLRHDWLAPLTLNFAPYPQKPPLLFWLINGSWNAFGVSRATALIPIVVATFLAVVLTTSLGRRLYPDLYARIPVVMAGTLLFIAYATVVMFDLTLTVFVAAGLLCLLAYARERGWFYPVALGALLGFGVLTKGPVMYLYLVFPMLLGPLWMPPRGRVSSWYVGMLGAFVVSLVPILAWLVPVLHSSGDAFSYQLLWQQTAGRITGTYGGSHARPVYFYFLLLPILTLPWVLFPAFLRNLASIGERMRSDRSLRFLLTCLVPTLLAFSLVAGKQPHYLVPLLPPMAILIAFLLRDTPLRHLGTAAVAMLALFVGLHAAMSRKVHEMYDLEPVAAFLSEQEEKPVAFAGSRYMGQLTFLARMDRRIEPVDFEDLAGWFDRHPEGLAVITYADGESVADYAMLMTHRYRARHIGVFVDRPPARMQDSDSR